MVAKNQSPVYKPITCPSTNTEQPRGYLFALALSIVQYSPIHRWWSFVKDRIGPSLLDSFDLWGSSWVLLTIRVQFRSVHIAFVKVSSRYFTVCSFEILWAIVTIDWKSFEKFDRIVLKIFDRVRASLHVRRLHERFSIFEENLCLVKRILHSPAKESNEISVDRFQTINNNEEPLRKKLFQRRVHISGLKIPGSTR